MPNTILRVFIFIVVYVVVCSSVFAENWLSKFGFLITQIKRKQKGI